MGKEKDTVALYVQHGGARKAMVRSERSVLGCISPMSHTPDPTKFQTAIIGLVLNIHTLAYMA